MVMKAEALMVGALLAIVALASAAVSAHDDEERAAIEAAQSRFHRITVCLSSAHSPSPQTVERCRAIYEEDNGRLQ
jgi:hypothetical protein